MKTVRNLTIAMGVVLLCACSNYKSGGTSDSGGAPATSTMDSSKDMGHDMGTETNHDMGTEMGTEMDHAMAADKKVDCRLVRCAACPDGQHPALKPPDCCRCIPN